MKISQQRHNGAVTRHGALGRIYGAALLGVALIGAASVKADLLDPLDLLVELNAAESKISNMPAVEPRVIEGRPEFLNFASEVESDTVMLASLIGDENSLVRKIWDARLKAPKENTEEDGSKALRERIAKLASLKFKAEEKTGGRVAPILERTASLEDEGAESEMQVIGEEKTTSKGEAVIADDSVVPARAHVEPAGESPLDSALDALLKSSTGKGLDSIENPMELADALYYSGRIEQAAGFYEEAYRRLAETRKSEPEDMAWALFQLGNCLKDSDPHKARAAYRQLISQYPDAPWSVAAEAIEKLLAWDETDEPRKLITLIDDDSSSDTAMGGQP